MERKKIIAGNWKMHKTEPETIEFIKKLAPEIVSCKPSVYIAVPFTSLHVAKKASEKTNVIIGAQNMHFEEKGAFTGEISAVMLKTAGAEFVLLGHSERRHVFHESDDMIAKKMVRALLDDLQPILCVGETEEERESGKTEKVLLQQLQTGLKKISEKEMEKVIVAYEPVWAIGTGKTATPEMAQKAHCFIRKSLKEMFAKTADFVPILYGGSVKPENSKELMSQKDIDGALIGGASLKPESFAAIINQC